jgi:hypothetical protein
VFEAIVGILIGWGPELFKLFMLACNAAAAEAGNPALANDANP